MIELASEFTLLLKSPETAPFTLVIPRDFYAVLNVDVSFCTSGSISPTTAVDLAEIEMILFPDNLVLQVNTTDTSGITSDNRCFRIKAFADITQYISFETIAITLQVPVGRLRTMMPAQTYKPSIDSSIFLDVIPVRSDGPALSDDPGPALLTEDRQPPVFRNCPTEVNAVVPAYQTSTVVSLPKLDITDNVGIDHVVNNMQSDVFYLKDSPITVTVTAFDLSENSKTCTYQVVLDYDRNSLVHDIFLDANEFTSSVIGTSNGVSHVADSLINATAGVHSQIEIFETSIYTNLQVLLTGEPGRSFFVNPFAGATANFYVDLLFAVDGVDIASIPVGNDSIYTTCKFLNLTDSNNNPNSTVSLPSTFHSNPLTTAVEGTLLRASCSSKVFSNEIRFDGIEVTLNFPSGLHWKLTDNLKLHPSSSVDFIYSFVDSPLTVVDFSRRGNRVHILDYEEPSFGDSCPSNMTFETLPDQASASVSWTAPIATDNIGVTSFVANFDPPSKFPIGTTQIIYTARDAVGNVAFCRFWVYVVDLELPILICPNATQVSLALGASEFATTSAIVAPREISDNSGDVFVSNNATAHFSVGSHDILLHAVDLSGNIASCSFVLKVIDTQPPIFSACPSSVSYQVDSQSNGREVRWIEPTAQDNTQIPPLITASNTSGSFFSLGTSIVRYTAVDQSMNVGVCSFQVDISHVSSSSSSTSTSTIVGIVVGLVVFFVVIVLILVLVIRRARRNRRKPHDFASMLQELSLLNLNETTHTPREIKRDHVRILEVLGKGNFGEVSKGLLTEITGTPGYIVAVKSLHDSMRANSAAILEEAAIMAQFQCQFTVGLVGVVTIDEPIMVVLEYCEHGALSAYLQRENVDDRMKHLIGGDCAEGLLYLASHNFVHRDIAARNVLISSERRAKISDFGLSRETEDSAYYQSRGGQLPIRWSAPEALEQHKFSSRSDCWSFGVLLYEIWTNAEVPYKGMTNQKVWVSVIGGYRLSCPSGCPSKVHDMMALCWSENPHDRPGFDVLLRSLRDWQMSASASPLPQRRSGGESSSGLKSPPPQMTDRISAPSSPFPQRQQGSLSPFPRASSGPASMASSPMIQQKRHGSLPPPVVYLELSRDGGRGDADLIPLFNPDQVHDTYFVPSEVSFQRSRSSQQSQPSQYELPVADITYQRTDDVQLDIIEPENEPPSTFAKTYAIPERIREYSIASSSPQGTPTPVTENHEESQLSQIERSLLAEAVAQWESNV